MTRTFTDLGEFAKFCYRIAAGHRHEVNAGIAAVAANIHRHAYHLVGDLEKLTPLKPETIAQKERKGYPQPEAPLIASGAMRDSLEWSLEPLPAGEVMGVAGVGSPDRKLLYHHLGSSRGLPPRPVLLLAMLQSEAESAAIFEPFAWRSLGLDVRLPRIAQPAVVSRAIVPKE